MSYNERDSRYEQQQQQNRAHFEQVMREQNNAQRIYTLELEIAKTNDDMVRARLEKMLRQEIERQRIEKRNRIIVAFIFLVGAVIAFFFFQNWANNSASPPENGDNPISVISSSDSATSSQLTTSSSIINESASTTEETYNPLVGYTEMQIEYARVWLTVMGTRYKDLEGFKLHVQHDPAGHPVNIYDEGTVYYPFETVTLSGSASFHGTVVYSSNHDGTITHYPAPSHWQLPADKTQDPEYIREITQKVLDDATVVPIPSGNPEDIKELINLMIIDS